MSLYPTIKDKVTALHLLVEDVIKNDLDINTKSLLKKLSNHSYNNYIEILMIIATCNNCNLNMPISTREELINLIIKHIKDLSNGIISRYEDDKLLCLNFCSREDLVGLIIRHIKDISNGIFSRYEDDDFLLSSYNITENTVVIFSEGYLLCGDNHRQITGVDLYSNDV